MRRFVTGALILCAGVGSIALTISGVSFYMGVSPSVLLTWLIMLVGSGILVMGGVVAIVMVAFGIALVIANSLIR